MVTTSKVCVHWSAEELDILRLYYNGKNDGTDFIRHLIQERFGITRTKEGLRRKAAHLGLTQFRRVYWSEEDELKLTNMLGKYSVKQIASRLNRSVNSIHRKLDKLGLSGGVGLRTEWYTLEDVCAIFGVGRTTVHSWISQKLITYSMATESIYHFTDKDLKTFWMQYPTEVNSRNVDMFQLRNILFPNYITIKDKR